MGKIIIEGNDIPEGETEQVVRRVKNALAREFEGSAITDEIDEEGNASLEIDADWVAEETVKEQERLKQKKKSDKEVQDYDEQVMELVNKIPDSSLPSLCQLLPPDMRLTKKYSMALETLERKKAELESELEENPSSKIYGRGRTF